MMPIFIEYKCSSMMILAVLYHIYYTLCHQGLIYHYLGSQRLAEKTLRDAARIDPTSHQTW